ncbi:PP12 [Orf virus]|uniref:PP12 n=1 Tax=Orf virus TaxID=10258 RepID=F1AXH3_ORFV|nr:PP12 [Orf virus]
MRGKETRGLRYAEGQRVPQAVCRHVHEDAAHHLRRQRARTHEPRHRVHEVGLVPHLAQPRAHQVRVHAQLLQHVVHARGEQYRRRLRRTHDVQQRGAGQPHHGGSEHDHLALALSHEVRVSRPHARRERAAAEHHVPHARASGVRGLGLYRDVQRRSDGVRGRPRRQGGAHGARVLAHDHARERRASVRRARGHVRTLGDEPRADGGVVDGRVVQTGVAVVVASVDVRAAGDELVEHRAPARAEGGRGCAGACFRGRRQPPRRSRRQAARAQCPHLPERSPRGDAAACARARRATWPRSRPRRGRAAASPRWRPRTSRARPRA